MSKTTIAAALVAGSGTGTPGAAAESNKNTVIVIRDFSPGQFYTIAFLTTEQAKALPAIPPDALQITILPAGNS